MYCSGFEESVVNLGHLPLGPVRVQQDELSCVCASVKQSSCHLGMSVSQNKLVKFFCLYSSVIKKKELSGLGYQAIPGRSICKFLFTVLVKSL